MRGQHLDGDGAVEAGIAGFVDLAHTPCPNGSEDLVGAKRGAWLERDGSVDGHAPVQLLEPVEHPTQLPWVGVVLAGLEQQEAPVRIQIP